MTLDAVLSRLSSRALGAEEREERWSEPRARACLHVGLELDAWDATDTWLVLGSALDALDRFVRFVHIPRRAPLGVRIRVAGLLRGLAFCARERDLDIVLPRDRRDLFADALATAIGDRDMFVSARAAFAAGALAATWPELAARVGLDGAEPAIVRRRAIASTAAWLHGDITQEELENRLEESARGNEFTYGSAILAMRLGWCQAPNTIASVLLDWMPQARTPGLASVGPLCALIDDEEVRARLQQAFAERAEALGDAKHPLLRPWLDQGAVTLALLADFRALKRTASDGATMAAPKALDLLGRLGHEPSDRGHDAATDLLLFDSTLLRDIAVAGAPDLESAAEARRTWLSVVAAERDRRKHTLDDEHVHVAVFNEQVRSLTHALDASYDERPAGEGSSDWSALLARLKARIATTDETFADRNAACAIAICLEAIATPFDDADDFVVAFAMPQRLLHHLSGAFSRSTLKTATSAAAKLRDALTRAKRIEASANTQLRKDDLPAVVALRDAVVAVAEAVSSFGVGGDHPLAMATRGAAAATEQMLRQFGSMDLLEGLWVSAIVAFEDALMHSHTRMGLPAPSPRERSTVIDRVHMVLHSPPHKKISDNIAPWPLGDLLVLSARLRGALENRSDRPPSAPVIGDYQVVRELGAGGMGRCLLAHLRADRKQQPWVLKLPTGRVRGDAGKATRDLFRQEAQALLGLASVEHPSIVPFVGYHERGYSSPFLVMGFVQGESLTSRLAKGPIPTVEAIRLARSLASGLAVAHARGIGHHDIKPDNIILAEGPSRAVLVDWGIAGAEFRTQRGTPGYMPPERFEQKKLDTTAALKGDIFALACVLYEMVTARALALPPLDDDDARIVPSLAAFAHATPENAFQHAVLAEGLAKNSAVFVSRLERHVAVVPGLRDLLTTMSRADHGQRPSATEVVVALDRLLS